MNWLVTGGCGFIGSSLVARLIATAGDQVRVLDNLTVGSVGDLEAVAEVDVRTAEDLSWDASGHVDLIVGDVLDEALVSRVAAGADVIVHLAANTGVGPSVEDPRSDCVTNVIGTLNCLEAARCQEVPRFVFASSGAPVGECDPPIHEEKVPHPVSPYGASKLAGEAYCSAYFRTFGVDTVALRFGNVYGPRSKRKSSVIAKFIRQALAGNVLEVYGDGSQTRDFIFIDDLTAAIVLAASADGAGGEVFQIATASETTLNEMLDVLKASLQRHGLSPEVRYTASRQGDVLRNCSDTSKAKRMLGWDVRIPLDQGIDLTIEWFLTSEDARA